MKNFLVKLRQVTIGASPIILIILAVHFFIDPMKTEYLVPLIISIFLLIFGQTFFLTGVDSSILTMGELVGNNIRKLKKLWIILVFGFLFGTLATVAEPAVSVLSTKVNEVNPSISTTLLTWVVSCGIGIFVAYGLFRIFKQFSIKWSIFVAYLVTFILIIFTPKEFHAIAFDFSGATTGVITVPFILALGVGVTAVLGRSAQNDSYGMIGLASIGPIITMCVMGIIFGSGTAGDFPTIAEPDLLASLSGSTQNILLALLPITVVFFVFNFAFIKLPRKKIGRIIYGIFVTVFGLILFLTAINFGFSTAGRHIGEAFATQDQNWFKYMLIPFGFLLGFAITYTEPAIRVLATQVEQTTGRKIKKNTMIFTLAIGLALTVTFGMLRILFTIDILYFLIPIFAFGLISMPFISNVFVGIAFDSGGVASGTITASFIVPFAIGACSMGLGSGNALIDGFGMIAFIAAIPIVAISVLGLIYSFKLKTATKALEKTKVREAKNLQNMPNSFIGIITKIEQMPRVNEYLKSLDAKVVTSFDSKGVTSNPASVFRLADEENIFLLALICETNAAKMITILETEFEYTKHNTGIAFTIPIDQIEI